MRARNVALTLALALGAVGIVSAEESGNWFTRLFTPSAEKKVNPDPAKVKEVQSEPAPMPPSASKIRAKQANADKERRDAVCLKLREIALAHGDEDMLRKVEQLENRVWDLYVAQNNVRTAPLAEASVKKGGR
jgi:hypothetical protein